jgi:hypothetical protein
MIPVLASPQYPLPNVRLSAVAAPQAAIGWGAILSILGAVHGIPHGTDQGRSQRDFRQPWS